MAEYSESRQTLCSETEPYSVSRWGAEFASDTGAKRALRRSVGASFRRSRERKLDCSLPEDAEDIEWDNFTTLSAPAIHPRSLSVSCSRKALISPLLLALAR